MVQPIHPVLSIETIFPLYFQQHEHLKKEKYLVSYLRVAKNIKFER